MRRQLITVAAALALVCASTALAGGWATVKLQLDAEGPVRRRAVGASTSRCSSMDSRVSRSAA